MSALLPSERVLSHPATQLSPGRRRARTILWTLLQLLFVGGICRAVEPPPLPDTPIVALAAVGVPDTAEYLTQRIPAVEGVVTTWLHDHGIRVVPASEFETAWRSRIQEAGGYFDTVSGCPDLAKRRALRASVLHDLHAREGVRVLLQPELVVMTAEYWHGKAAWDGAKETAAPTGSGELPALSLAIRVEDINGREAASARAGIQLLAKYSIWNSNYGQVARGKVLADEQKLREAVNLALSAVLDALQAPSVVPATIEIPAKAGAAEAVETEIESPPAGARIAALRELLLPKQEVVVPRNITSRYLGLLSAQLERAGWWTLSADTFEETLRAVALERGGIYDPITGKEGVGKLPAAIEEARRRVAVRFGANLFVTGSILVRPARILGESAAWDGVSEKVADIATWKKLLVTTQGTVKALTFGVVVQDVDGTIRYSGWGGIQLIERIEGDRFVTVPPGELFADPSRDLRAVDLSLKGWAAEPIPTRPK
jgi:hypothetical protein